jgi:hypothetical protein
VHNENAHCADDACDRHDVADKIECKIVVQSDIPCVARPGQEERIAIRRRSHDCFGGDIAAGTRSVFDKERLTGPLR